MNIIGLTGGIASGKSTVSRILGKLGAVIIDADKIARKAVEPGEKGLYNIVCEFGKEVLSDDGTLDRKALGNIVFNDPGKLKVLNEITHPEIRKVICDALESIRKNDESSTAVIDAAVLLESGMDELVDEVWLVYVDYETQVKRLMMRDSITREEAYARINSQMPVEDKIKRSDKIIDNTKDVAYTEQQVNKLWYDIISRHGGKPIAFQK